MKTINIIDNQFSHGTSLGSGDLPIYPKNFKWDRTLHSPNRYVFVTEGSFNNPILNSIAPVNRIAFLIEPASINSASYNYVKQNQNQFAYILSHDKEFVRQIPNGLYYPFGGCWIRPEERQVYPKTKLCSIIVSEKKITEGHRKRHEFVQQFASKYKVDVFGRGYKLIDNKLEALKDYCYSIVIENELSKGWFTEKLIDCLVTGVIPIYAGAPDIHGYFGEMKGFLNYNKVHELFAHEEKNPGAMFSHYRSELSTVNKMFELAQKYTCPEDWIFERYPQLFI